MANDGTARRDEALATFAESLSQALARLAIDLRSAGAADAPQEEVSRGLTRRQAEALAVVTASGPDGLASAELVAAIGGTQANATKLLDKLAGKREIARVPAARPVRWAVLQPTGQPVTGAR